MRNVAHCFFWVFVTGHVLLAESPWRDVELTPSRSDVVRPWTGLVLRHDSEHAATDAISMEYSYVPYDDCVTASGQWD